MTAAVTQAMVEAQGGSRPHPELRVAVFTHEVIGRTWGGGAGSSSGTPTSARLSWVSRAARRPNRCSPSAGGSRPNRSAMQLASDPPGEPHAGSLPLLRVASPCRRRYPCAGCRTCEACELADMLASALRRSPVVENVVLARLQQALARQPSQPNRTFDAGGQHQRPNRANIGYGRARRSRSAIGTNSPTPWKTVSPRPGNAELPDSRRSAAQCRQAHSCAHNAAAEAGRAVTSHTPALIIPIAGRPSRRPQPPGRWRSRRVG
jgi:hypothetical protein